MKKCLLIATLTCLTLLTGCTQRVIFDNGNYSTNSSYTSDPSSSRIVASSFTLERNASSISGFRWWGRYLGSNTPQELDEFRIQVYTDENGFPGLEVLDTYVGGAGRATTAKGGGSTVYEYSTSIVTQQLLPETTYWLSIFNDTTIDDNDEWTWMSADEPRSGKTVQDLTVSPGVWESASDTPRAFQVTAMPF